MGMLLEINYYRGYSIIELIVIILILAILVVVMLPKFLDLKGDANDASRAQVVAAFRQAVALAQTKWELEGRPQGGNINNGPQIAYNSELLVTVSSDKGWPVGDHNRDVVNNMNLQDCEQVFNDLVQHDYIVRRRNDGVTNGNFRDFDIIVTRTNTNPDTCNYYWSDTLSSRPNNALPSTGHGFQYLPDNGSVTTFGFN